MNRYEVEMRKVYKYILLFIVVFGVAYYAKVKLYDKHNNEYSTKEEKIFSKIYETDFWTNGSGPGSHPDVTVEYRGILQKLFNDDRMTTYVDVGCGDWQFMKLIEIPENKTYVGYDIVKSVIDKNKELYEKDNIRFYHNTDINNIQGGDLLIVKDVMIHWPNEQVSYFIKNVLPKFKYALFTEGYCSKEEGLNSDLDTHGKYRCIDVSDAPFNLENTELILEFSKSFWKKRIYFYTNPNK